MKTGSVISINISPGGVPKRPVESATVLSDRLEGDGRNHEKHDKPHRAVSLLGINQVQHFANLGYEVGPGDLGENLTVGGVDVQSLEAGDVLEFEGGVIIEISEPRIPCYVLDAIDPKLKDDSWGCCGMMARINNPGKMHSGESFKITHNAIKDSREIWPHTAVILAGGDSRRMGQPKEGVRLPDGRTMIETVIESLESVASRIVVVGKCAGFEHLGEHGIQRIDDNAPGRGPLGGIEAVLASGLDDRYLFAACDQPLLTPYLLRFLCRDNFESAFLRTEMGEKLDPFPGIVPATWHAPIREALTAGNLRVREVLRELEPNWVTISSKLKPLTKGFNTPEELAKLGR